MRFFAERSFAVTNVVSLAMYFGMFSSLYPITTIALGRILQGQSATRIQLGGIILALGSAALLGASTR